MNDQPTLVDLAPPIGPPISERHVQSVAAALHALWGPCDTDNADDCNGVSCHVTLVRAVLEQSARTPHAIRLDLLAEAQKEAWHVACCYGDLLPPEARRFMPSGGEHMALNKAHMGTVVARIAPILGGEQR